MRLINKLCIGVLGGFLLSCSQQQVFKIEGSIKHVPERMLYLENIGVAQVTVVDSVKLDADGQFSFIQPRPDIPDFYRLRIDKQWINLAVDSTEQITVHADASAGYAREYTVESSRGSDDLEKIKTLTRLQLQAAETFNTLQEAQKQHPVSQEAYIAEIEKAIHPYKAVARQYIYEHPASTAAYFALFQQINNLLIFDPYDKDDNKCYASVATAWDLKYGDHPRAKQLHDITIRAIQEIRKKKRRPEALKIATALAYFEVSLPDAHGTIVNLSDLIKEKKVILLDFTAYQAQFSPVHNMDLGELYEKYYAKGLDIFQVSLDADLNFWQNVSLNIPWICVRDPETVYSGTAAMYNVKELPATFILNREGEIVKRLTSEDDPEDEIKKLL
jgi:glutathione peroxidase-family protein